MLNVNLAVSSFWQLARHWKCGEKAKLQLACEGGNLPLQLSASLCHPDHVYFPTPSSPPFPPSCKRKSPSQLRRQERRQEEALSKVQKGDSLKEAKSKHSKEEVVEIVSEDSKKISAEKPGNNSSIFKCDQCDNTASYIANLTMHIKKEHKEVQNEDVHPIT